MSQELVEKVQAALLAIQDLEEALEEEGAHAEAMDACGLAAEGMENLACELGFGVINGVIVPR